MSSFAIENQHILKFSDMSPKYEKIYYSNKYEAKLCLSIYKNSSIWENKILEDDITAPFLSLEACLTRAMAER